MEFKKVSVNGIIYGEGVTEAMVGAAKREGREVIDLADQEITLKASLGVMLDVSTHCSLHIPSIRSR